MGTLPGEHFVPLRIKKRVLSQLPDPVRDRVVVIHYASDCDPPQKSVVIFAMRNGRADGRQWTFDLIRGPHGAGDWCLSDVDLARFLLEF
jgi:hypothetical protein